MYMIVSMELHIIAYIRFPSATLAAIIYVYIHVYILSLYII